MEQLYSKEHLYVITIMSISESSSSGLSRQDYIGIAVGGFFAILAVVAVIIFILCGMYMHACACTHFMFRLCILTV